MGQEGIPRRAQWSQRLLDFTEHTTERTEGHTKSCRHWCRDMHPNVHAAAAAAKSLQSCLTLCDPTRLPRPWDSPGKNTGVACHFLLQCMKVKSENEVTQLCPTLRNPAGCSLPGSSAHGIFQARVLEWVPSPSLVGD